MKYKNLSGLSPKIIWCLSELTQDCLEFFIENNNENSKKFLLLPQNHFEELEKVTNFYTIYQVPSFAENKMCLIDFINEKLIEIQV